MNFDSKQWHDCYIDLNMQNGLLTTQYINEDDDDHHFQVKVTRLIDNHTVMLHYELTPLDFDGVINVTNQFSADGEFSVNDNVINYANHDTTVTMQLVTDSDYQIKSDNHCAVQTLTINGQQAQLMDLIKLLQLMMIQVMKPLKWVKTIILLIGKKYGNMIYKLLVNCILKRIFIMQFLNYK